MIAAPVAPRDGAAGIRVQQGGALALDAPFDVGVLRPIETEALRPNVYYPGLDRRVRPVLGLQVRPAKVRFRGQSGHMSRYDGPGSFAPFSVIG
jgi:hypothetical protein